MTRPHDFSLPMTKGQVGANIGRSLIHDVFGAPVMVVEEGSFGARLLNEGCFFCPTQRLVDDAMFKIEFMPSLQSRVWMVPSGFPEMMTSGRPYYDLPMYTAQLDEV